MTYAVVNKRSQRHVSHHSMPGQAAEEIVKAGAWSRWEVQRVDGADLDGAELHVINKILYPALAEEPISAEQIEELKAVLPKPRADYLPD